MNKKINTIIVGIDFSKYSRAVVKQAERLALSLKVPIVYIHVFDDPFLTDWASNSELEHVKREFEDKLRKRYAIDTKTKVIVKCGEVSHQILDAAKDFKNPLIIVGHRGMGPIQRFFIGSTAQNLARKSSHPVWIHRGMKAVNLKDILIPCDLSARTEHSLKLLTSMGLKKNSNVQLFHVFSPPPPILDYKTWSQIYGEVKVKDSKRLENFKRRHPHIKISKAEGDVSSEIQKQGKNFDLIAITPRSHGGIFQNLGSVTSKIVRQGETSVLIVP